jgi:hypothetical protein
MPGRISPDTPLRRPLAMPTLSTETPSGVTRRRLARIATEVRAPWVWVLGLPLIVAWKVTGYHFGETVLWGSSSG